MSRSIAAYLKQTTAVLDPFAPPGELMFTQQSRWQFNNQQRRLIAIVCYGLCLLSAYVLFKSYADFLTPHNLLTTDIASLTKALLMPIASFAICMYTLNMGLSFARTPAPLYFLPFVFITANKQQVATYLGSLILLCAFLFYYQRFTKVFYEFKQPSLAKAFAVSFGLFIAIISLAMTISYYSSFSDQVSALRDRVSNAASKQLAAIYTDSSQEIPNETLYTRAIHYLKGHDQPTTPQTIAQEERNILKNLGLKTANVNDSYRMLLEQAIQRQVNTTVNNYRMLIGIIVPFAFFFVTNTLTGIACNVSWFLLAMTERITKQDHSSVQNL